MKLNRQQIIWIIAGAIFLVAGYAVGRAYKTYEIKMADMHKENMQNNSHNMADMHNQKELVSTYVYAPKIVKLEAFKDSMSGYNLKINTQYFRFTPEKVGQEVIQNTGHAHIYVNDVKVGRTYGAWYNIPESFFKNGTNTISVTLNANNHNVWWSKQGTLEARENILVFKN